jgi:hypothetical protein
VPDSPTAEQIAMNDQPIIRGQNESVGPETEMMVPVPAPQQTAPPDRGGLRWRNRRQQRAIDQAVAPTTSLAPVGYEREAPPQQLSRPQPPQQVEQTILQWTRDGQPAAPPVQPAGGQSFYDRGRILR